MMDIGIEAQKFTLVFFRIVSVLWLIPLLSSRFVSATFKAGLSLLIAFLLFSSVNVAVSVDVLSNPYSFLLLTLREVFIGITIGFIAKIIFSSISVAGDIMSLQAGFSFARFMDPFTMTQVSVLEQVKNLLAIMIFFAIDAHHIVFQAISTSFTELPIGAVALREPLLRYVVNATSRVFSLGFKIGAPVIVTLFLVDLAFGLLARMIPQVNIFIEGVPIKILIAMIMLTVSLGVTIPVIASLFKAMDNDFIRVFRLMV